jgi:hypothetical protein
MNFNYIFFLELVFGGCLIPGIIPHQSRSRSRVASRLVLVTNSGGVAYLCKARSCALLPARL